MRRVMGIGADYQLVPWDSLDFDDEAEGYIVETEQEPKQQAADAVSYFNYALGTEPIGHYGLDSPEETAK